MSYLDKNNLGICVGADSMLRIAPGLVRVPDLSFSTPGAGRPGATGMTDADFRLVDGLESRDKPEICQWGEPLYVLMVRSKPGADRPIG
jgi:hypothetical protein